MFPLQVDRQLYPNSDTKSFPVSAADIEQADSAEVISKRTSIFLPHEAALQESEESFSEVCNESRQRLNHFLQAREISPVRHQLSVPWNAAKSRTKRRYLRKAEQCVSAVTDALAPDDSDNLWGELCEHRLKRRTVAGKSGKDLELLEAFAESYCHAHHWSTRRQILSILADKLSFKELQELIPSVTNYRYKIARHHILLHGRAEPVPSHGGKRMKVEPAKLEHFVSFITSPHVLQDVPFGEKLLKLSTGEVIKTPNVIRIMIPERMIQQYQQYCSETGYEPMSKRTLHRVLQECAASVRKSLQGLDNFSAQGTEAFDDLNTLVDKLVDLGKTQVWAREMKQKLRSAKQYLKGDYKVRAPVHNIFSDKRDVPKLENRQTAKQSDRQTDWQTADG